MEFSQTICNPFAIDYELEQNDSNIAILKNVKGNKLKTSLFKKYPRCGYFIFKN